MSHQYPRYHERYETDLSHRDRMPFAVGAIVQARGVQSLQPVILSFLLLLLVIWLMLPSIPRHEHQN